MTQNSKGFVHLNLHTEFSLVDGIVRIKPLIGAVAEAGMPAVAMTDHVNLYGMVKFYRAAMAAGVKPIVGSELWLQEAVDFAEGPSRFIVLVRTTHGYTTLTRLISRAYMEGQQGDRPVIRRDWIEADHEGLIVLSGGRDGDVGRALLAGDTGQARARLQWWLKLFPDSYYLELQRCGRPGDEDHLHAAVALANAESVPVVATNAVRFLKAEDFEAHEARVCIHQSRTLDDARRPRDYSEEQYLRTPDEMIELFSDVPEAIDNTLEIARRCNLDITLGENFLPDFPIPDGMTIDDFLRRESRLGLERRLERLLPAEAPDREQRCTVYRERLERELDVIIQMGFPGYFLIVADFIRWAKDNGIPVGPGRGSGAGSLVAYALDITDLDPLRYDLLFERFLNPERVSMPDFDVDFCMEGRDRVIDYVAAKYGREKVSQIATHGTMAARAVVRDVGRVLGHPYGFVDRIAKLIPFEIGMTLDKALKQEAELREQYESDEEISTLLDLGRKLEGVARNVGKHAGGVVIAPSELTDFSPLYCEPGGTSLATHYDKDDVESVGLVKFDFLGLRTLTIIDWTVKAINVIRGERNEQPLVIEDIPLEDRPTFELLKRCQTTAVFQLESRGMKDLIKRLQPDSFEDIIALVALFRPGPLQSGMVDDFIDRKQGRAKLAYPTPELHHVDLEPVLKPTYGVILYQEQVQRIAQVLAGYSLGGADLLRRAMGKKKPEEMAKQRQIFLDGAMANGLSAEHAGGIFDLMEKFAGYGFNKSHSAAYALLSYQTAWLKAHYPAPFMAAVLSSDMDHTDKVVTLIEECRDMGLEVLPPDVNRSGYKFRAADETTIVYGLGAVKGVGQGAIDSMVEEREANGPYQDVRDLCRRVDSRRINRRVLEALVRAGCLDSIGHNRASLMAAIPDALRAAEQQSRNAEVGQNDLFGTLDAAADDSLLPSASDPEHPEWPEEERLQAEKETLGLYLTGHPISRYEAELEKVVTARINALAGGNGGQPGQDGGRGRGERKVVAAGLVMSIRTRNTQSGDRIAFLVLDDRTGRIEVSLFTEAYRQYGRLLGKDQLVVVEGALGYDDFNDGWRINAERVLDIGDVREAYARRLVMKLGHQRLGNGALDHLQQTLAPFRDGRCPVWLEYSGDDADAVLRFGESWRVRPTDELLQRLTALTGDGAVRVEY
ncbi:DNA polymerase-3 subunit alpha [Natronocella acetinitrilica]|uniref:DNA polymerase III subunit alpha n=1 Tax=Natronocella acetinitrilica TaxID=414046 RepID=A0AAE3G5S7_9GAMM|nr:DNA polymerase III subunit alpha [Natronocella acetinitrilica]MCP1676164.1 DNA polymerase-3 subunit alpha [Natronocella acetinitrilica]